MFWSHWLICVFSLPRKSVLRCVCVCDATSQREEEIKREIYSGTCCCLLRIEKRCRQRKYDVNREGALGIQTFFFFPSSVVRELAQGNTKEGC